MSTNGPDFGPHVPGPWRLDADANRGDWQVIDSAGIHVIADRPDSFEAPNSIANARLIAAAPDLLSALEALYAATPDCDGDHMVIVRKNGDRVPVLESKGIGEACRRARLAIAAARGDSERSAK